MSANLENSAVGTGLERVSFNSNPKEGQYSQRIFRLPHNCTHPYASKAIFKILQARLQQYVNWKLPDIKFGFRKGRGTRDQIANICWVVEKAREFQKNIYLCFIDCAKAFDGVDHNRLWKAVKEMGIPDHLTCLLKELYVGHEPRVRTRNNWLVQDWARSMAGLCAATVCLTRLLSKSWEMLGWMSYRLESTEVGETSATSDMQMT